MTTKNYDKERQVMSEPTQEAVLQWIERGPDEVDRTIRHAMAVAWQIGLITLTPTESGDMMGTRTEKQLSEDELLDWISQIVEPRMN